MTPSGLLLGYCVLIALASLAGGWLPSLVQLTHLRRQLMMSLVSGVMLGVALLHMLPQSVEQLPSISAVGASMLGGVLVMFFLLRVFHVHAHDTAEEHHQDHGDNDQHQHQHDHGPPANHRVGWLGLLVGLVIHSLLDGVAVAAGVAADTGGEEAAALLGLGTFLAVLLHKPLDALSIASLMHASGWSSGSRTLVNCLFALSSPAGALLFWQGAASELLVEQSAVVGCALAFSAGFFLCIALSDLLPEVAFHTHDRLQLSTALLLGVALAFGIESMHTHEHPHSASPGDSHEHEGHGH